MPRRREFTVSPRERDVEDTDPIIAAIQGDHAVYATVEQMIQHGDFEAACTEWAVQRGWKPPITDKELERMAHMYEAST